jgi:hypothetical protein
MIQPFLEVTPWMIFGTVSADPWGDTVDEEAVGKT